ncbi:MULTISPECIES: SprT-like domain-containing protein [unclassified Actinomyces]|uniref:SprT-like domain-containing protein n=1 Tax=unclassified Actinomyces TaxID=2609248 RepID=UPI002016FDE2|nr:MULTISPECIES: SprT-like domain-containing protein [unclassified Actinomyces]MCL3777474.1 SprT-like domain-containing protein [Actinomyces sp. AC-20-1]MCL3790712.1 SprT-like domain-containing protein [Actinomyces sp. 187325]MCL3793008.1 SprT-like domain-containing protein [Actinomyces sp. 186855]MCL3795445.1 SprT-like domain-containing protein [Actinomyces sp. 217892]
MEIPAVLALARALMQEHGVGDWGLELDRARRRAGLTDHARHRITLSRALMGLYDETEVRETVLHEIAHARVGARHGHDAVWRAEAQRLGASGRRLVPRGAPQVEGRWRGTCPAGHTVARLRRPSVPLACAACGRSFSLDNLLSWTYDGRSVTEQEIGPRYARALAAARRRLDTHRASAP